MDHRLTAAAIIALTAVSCAVPDRPTSYDIDLVDRSYREPSEPSESKKLLSKEELSLEDVLRLADLLSPKLESLRKDIDLAPLAAWGESIFPNPSLNLEVEEFPTEEQRSLGASERGFGIGQPIPVGGRLGAASSVAEAERQAAAFRYLWERRQFLTGIKKAFMDYLAARDNVGLATQTRDIAKQFHDLTQERFTAQAIPEMELLKAAVNLAKAEADLKAAQTALRVSVKRIHAGMGDVDFPVERFVGDLNVRFEVPSLESLRGQVIVTHPEIELAKQEEELARRQRDLAKARRIPDLDVEVALKWTPDEERILESGVSIPLPIFNRNQAEVAASEIQVRKAELRLHDARNEALLSLEETYRTFAAAQDRVTTYRDTILPKAQKALEQTDEGYRAGKFTYLDVLDAQQTLAEARQAYLSALDDLNRLSADLEKVTGTSLKGIR